MELHGTKRASENLPGSDKRDFLPDGVFESEGLRDVEPLTLKDVKGYIDLFERVLIESPYYTEGEKEGFISDRSPEEIGERVQDPNWYLLAIKDGEDKLAATLEARIITMKDGTRLGNILWTLVDDNYRRRGLATELKLRFEEILRQSDVAGIITSIKHTNTASIEMNRKLGLKRDDNFPSSSDEAAWYTKQF